MGAGLDLSGKAEIPHALPQCLTFIHVGLADADRSQHGGVG
jgi:hypothetical protein